MFKTARTLKRNISLSFLNETYLSFPDLRNAITIPIDLRWTAIVDTPCHKRQLIIATYLSLHNNAQYVTVFVLPIWQSEPMCQPLLTNMHRNISILRSRLRYLKERSFVLPDNCNEQPKSLTP